MARQASAEKGMGMRSYREIAHEAGASVEDVREAMRNARKRSIPFCRTYDDFRNPPNPLDWLAGWGRMKVVEDVFWSTWIHDVSGRGRTREGAVIGALSHVRRS